MSLSRLGQLAWRVILQIVADRRSLALMFVVPVVLLTVVNILFGIEPSHVTVGVVNADAGVGGVSLGDALVERLGSVDFFDIVQVAEAEGRDQVAAGDLDALIILSPDLTATAVQTGDVNLTVIYNGSDPNIANRLSTLFEQSVAQALNTVLASTDPSMSARAPRTPEVILSASYVNGGSEFTNIDYVAPAMIGLFVFMFVFLLTGIAFLRERLTGTLERLKASPIRPLELVTGYMLGFLLFGLLQGLVTLLYTVYVIDVHYNGDLLTVFVVEVLLVITSVNLGIFMSTFAQNEFQVLQFIPLIVVSQTFLGGLFWAVEDMPAWLQPIAQMMPITHATRAMRQVMIENASLVDIVPSLVALAIIATVILGISARTAASVKV